MTTYALDEAVFAAQIKAGLDDPALAERIIQAITQRLDETTPLRDQPLLATQGATTPGDIAAGAAVAVFESNPPGPITLPADVQVAIFRGDGNLDLALANNRPAVMIAGSGDDRIAAEQAGAPVTAALGAGDDVFIGAQDHANTVSGGAGADTMTGGDHADVFQTGEGADLIDGGRGFDRVSVDARFADLDLGLDDSGALRLTAPDGTVITLHDVEYLSFTDGAVIVNLPSDAAAALARGYEAVFGRAPDADGMAFWTQQASEGPGLLQSVETMLKSPEFEARHGAVDDLDPAVFIRIAYQNALGREPDEAGLKFWMEELERGVSKAEAMLTIAHATESLALSDLTILKTPGG